MDPISQKILNAKKIREEAEAERLRQEQERLAKKRANPEYLRFERFKRAREQYFTTFKERCLTIQSESKDADEKFRLQFNPLSLDGANRAATHFSASIDETRLSIQLDPSGDEGVDFFGTITVLGQTCARKTFFVIPPKEQDEGEFRVIADGSDPLDFYMLYGLMKAGMTTEVSTFAKLLDEGLNALASVAIDGHSLPSGWNEVYVRSPLLGGTAPGPGADPKAIKDLMA